MCLILNTNKSIPMNYYQIYVRYNLTVSLLYSLLFSIVFGLPFLFILKLVENGQKSLTSFVSLHCTSVLVCGDNYLTHAIDQLFDCTSL